MIMTTREERRRIAIAAIRENPGWSDRRLEAHTKLSREMIAAWRYRLIKAGEIPESPRLGSDGKVYRNCSKRKGTNSLLSRTARVRRMLKYLKDDPWHDADPRLRRLFWLSVERLAEEAGKDIDLETGEFRSHRAIG